MGYDHDHGRGGGGGTRNLEHIYIISFIYIYIYISPSWWQLTYLWNFLNPIPGEIDDPTSPVNTAMLYVNDHPPVVGSLGSRRTGGRSCHGSRSRGVEIDSFPDSNGPKPKNGIFQTIKCSMLLFSLRLKGEY